MAITAFPYTAVLDVSANSLLGNNTGSPTAAIALTATQVRTLLSVYTSAQVDSLLAGYQPLDADLTAIAALTTTSFGRSLLTQTDAAATRTTIGAGTSSFSGAYGDLSGIPGTFTPSAHKTSHATGGSDALTAADVGAVPTSRTLTINGTTQDLSANRTFTVSAGVSGSTGSVDNAMLRADGTGGSTLQASDWLMADNYTTSPNNTVNHASLQATGGTTNVSVSIVPKGSGAFMLDVPDGTSAGGNARGANAVDLQTSRTAANQVASGPSSVTIGAECKADIQSAVAIGLSAVSSGFASIALGSASCTGGYAIAIGGRDNFSSASYSVAIGSFVTSSNAYSVAFSLCTASGAYSWACGRNSTASAQHSMAFGREALANRENMAAYAQGQFAAAGDAQRVEWVLRNKTTDGTTAVTLFADGASVRCSLTSGKVLHATVLITGSKSDGSAVAVYMRQVAIKNVGGTTSLVGTVNTLGTDTAAGTSIAITADDTNDALQIAVTGVASETWRWTAVVYGVELAYGT